MKNRWITFLAGRVLVKAEGTGIERLLNTLTRQKVTVWKVKRLRTGAIFFYILLRDLHRIRKIARGFECSLSFVRGEGIPFLMRRLIKNGGFLVGIFLFLIALTLLSNITWGIKIKGANPETEHQIRKELDKLGIEVGTSHFFKQDLEKIQRELTDRVDNITWVGVDLKGTTFHFQVVEKTEPKTEKGRPLSDLVAGKKAVISKLFVEKGKPIVRVNQYVRKGQLLVSGTIGPEDKPKYVGARGEVWGKTWYTSSVEFPLKSSFHVFNGGEKRAHLIQIGSLAVPIWGFGEPEFKDYMTEMNKHPLRFLGRQLPLAYVEKTMREKEEFTRELTKKEAVGAAKELALRDLAKHLPEDAQVDKEIILHEDVENGKVKLTIYFQVIENIAKEKPITRGD